MIGKTNAVKGFSIPPSFTVTEFGKFLGPSKREWEVEVVHYAENSGTQLVSLSIVLPYPFWGFPHPPLTSLRSRSQA